MSELILTEQASGETPGAGKRGVSEDALDQLRILAATLKDTQ